MIFIGHWKGENLFPTEGSVRLALFAADSTMENKPIRRLSFWQSSVLWDCIGCRERRSAVRDGSSGLPFTSASKPSEIAGSI